jgi:hypothetical protein
MGSNTNTAKKLTNGAILIMSKVLKHVVSSAAEAKCGAVNLNAKEGAVLRTTSEELGHPHPSRQWKHTIPLPQDTAMAH